MLLKETIKKIIIEQQKLLNISKKDVPRTILSEIEMNNKFIIILTGIRRSGKSTLLKQLMGENPNFINFEDPKTSSFELSDFEKLTEVFNQKKPFFFDEIQNIPNWERFVRYAHDKKIKIVITGSNASLLSKELGTKLTGRYLSYEIFPFSYREFLIYTKQKTSPTSFEQYIKQGGFPEFLETKNPLILQRIFKDVLARDIIVRHNIKQTKLLEEVAVFFLSNSAKEISLNKLSKLLKVKSTNTLSQYLSFLEDSYVVLAIPQFSYSIKKQILNPKKIYAIDTGFAKANSLSFSKDDGRILETSVFLHLRRKYDGIFYFQEKHECDFLIKEKGEITKAIQVSLEITEQNKKREFEGLVEALEEFNLKEGLIVTKKQEEVIKLGNKKIKLVPAWKWMLK